MNENQTPQPVDTTPAGAGRDNMKLRKKIVKIALIVCAVIVVLYLATLTLDPDALVNRWFHGDEGKVEEIEFYPVDEDLDIFEDAEYKECDNRVFYYDPDTGATYSVEKEELAQYDAHVRFFYDYFQSVIMGDAIAYAAYFTDDYEGDIPKDFTMQMLYDIRVQPYYSEETGEHTYLVEYRILKNNGTFRRDIGSKVSRTQLYTLREEYGEYRIERIRPFKQY